jgi:high-affinity iron transporter
MFVLLRILAVFLLAPTGAAAAAPSPEQVRKAERVLQLVPGVVAEYAEAFDESGGLARPIELEEAGLLLAEARDLVPALGVDVERVAAIEQAIADRAAQRVVEELASALTASVTAATGVSIQQFPPSAPSAARGRTLYEENCASCHGADGAGGGEESRRLGLTPANFTDADFMRLETPDDFFNVVTLGRRRSGMPSWSEALSVQERWDLVRYVWTFSQPVELVERGRSVLDAQCPTCASPFAEPADVLARRSDADLAATLDGAAQVTTLDPAARAAVVAAIRARAFDATVGAAVPSMPREQRSAREGLVDAHRLIDEARTAHARGDAAATGLATDAYMRFEPYEKRLGAVDAGMVSDLEEDFVRLRMLIRGGGSTSDVAAVVETLHRRLDDAAERLETGSGAWVRFVQSAGIILREGFEVILVVGALLAYVRRSGQPAMVRALHAGALAGVGASAATWLLFTTVLPLTPLAAEAIEGGAMLLAAVVLFWVSYWLVSKAEADRWQRYIRGKVEGALAAGSGTALGTASFLAVYREGFETILFYQALFASAPAGDVMVPAGLVAGVLALVVLWVGLGWLGLRVPMRAFFLGTSAFLYAMAIVFAGRGVAELQEAAIVSTTPVAWAPRIETLGVFPTVETLVAQGIFVALLVYAVVVTVVRRRAMRAAAAATPAHQPPNVAQG